MPGYDKNRFINLKDEDELMCGICHGIFIDPNVTPCCRQTYCADCIKQWLEVNSSCPNDRQPLHANNLFPAPRIIFNMLNKLLMKCEYRKNGCKENFILENIEGHIKICVYNPNNICIDCDHLIGNRSSHNCIKNLKSENKKLKEDNKVIEHECHLLQVILNSVNEKCDNHIKELNDFKETINKYEKQIKMITEENKSLNLNKSELVLKNKKLEDLSSKLYNNLKSIESDMIHLPTINESDLNIVAQTLTNFVDSDTQKNNIIHKLSKFSTNIENDKLFKEVYNITKIDNVSDSINVESASNPFYMIDYKARSVEIIRFTIGGFSKLTFTITSPPSFVRNLPWKIIATPRTETEGNKSTKYLKYYIECNGESDSTTWLCIASVELRIISQKEGVENFSRKIMHKFCRERKDRGFKRFMAWNDILNEDKGFIKDDNIILEVMFHAENPQGI